MNGRPPVLEDYKSDSNKNTKLVGSSRAERGQPDVTLLKSCVPWFILLSCILDSYGVQRPAVRPLQNTDFQLLFIHNSIKVRLRFHFLKKFPGDFNATEFANVGEGVEPPLNQELFLYYLMFSSWGLWIKLTKDRLTGEKVTFTCILRLHRTEVNTPKRWLDPGLIYHLNKE